MSEGARVRFVGVLDEWRGALAQFADQAVLALESVEAEMRRAHEGLEEQDRYWQGEIRKLEEQVFLAKQDLARRRMMKMGDRPVDCWEQEKELRRVRGKLEFAQEKQETTRHWLRQWASEMIEFEGPTRQLKSFLEADLLRANALLHDKAATLESYLAIASPSEGLSQKPLSSGERGPDLMPPSASK